MKLLIIMLLISPVWAKTPQILRCLAEEEYSIHKNKSKQHLYRLNQLLVNEFAAAYSIELDPNKLEHICNSSPSEELLKALLLEGKSIFRLSPTLLENERYVVKASINRLLDQAADLFFEYLLVLENNTGIPGCLQQEIPEIKSFNSQFQNLQVEMSRKRLLADKDKIKNIFNGIKNFDAIRKKCQSKKATES